MSDVSKGFLDESRAFLTGDYMPAIERCAAQLTDDQIWRRANEASNSIGNLILHLTWSSRYWAVEVIGGKPIGRVRQREFDQREPIPRERLMADLRAAMAEVDDQLARTTPAGLLETRPTRMEQRSVLWCVYHIVEHFSMHTGQILSMTKDLIGALTEAES